MGKLTSPVFCKNGEILIGYKFSEMASKRYKKKFEKYLSPVILHDSLDGMKINW